MHGTCMARLKILLTWYKLNDFPHEMMKGVPIEWLANKKNLDDNMFNTELGKLCKKDSIDKEFINLFKSVCTDYIRHERGTSDN